MAAIDLFAVDTRAGLMQPFAYPEIWDGSAVRVELNLRRCGTFAVEELIRVEVRSASLTTEYSYGELPCGLIDDDRSDWYAFDMNHVLPIPFNTPLALVVRGWSATTDLRHSILVGTNWSLVDCLAYSQATQDYALAHGREQGLLFRVAFGQDTGQQIASLVADNGALAGSSVGNTGIYSQPDKRGDSTALELVADMVRSGKSNGEQLGVTVGAGKTLAAYPLPNEVQYRMGSDGVLRPLYGGTVQPWQVQVGAQVLLDVGIAGLTSTRRIAATNYDGGKLGVEFE